MQENSQDRFDRSLPQLGLVAAARLIAGNAKISLGDAATIYGQSGLPVFPCDPKTKAPLIQGGHKSATMDAIQIRKWWKKWPDAMIGMPTGPASGVWVLDIDEMNTFIAGAKIALPHTLTVVTGNGEHRYWAWDISRPVKNAQKTMKDGAACWPFPELPGADARGDGGYVIVPPSIHPSGRAYLWNNVVPPATPPAALIRCVTNRAHATAQRPAKQAGTALDRKAETKGPAQILKEECESVRAAQNGSQEATLNSAGLKIGRLVGFGKLPYEDAMKSLLQAAQAMPSYNSDHPWTPENLGQKVAKAIGDGAKKARAEQKAASQPSEVECAVEFIKLNKDKVRYNCTANKWLVWSGFHWKDDSKNLVQNRIQELVRRMSGGDKSCCRSAFISGVKKLASADPAITVVQEEFDADPFLLGTPGGTVELKTGKLRPARPTDLITRVTATGPRDAPPKKWLEFIDQVTGGDSDFKNYLQKLVGYCLTGAVKEQTLFFFAGEGQNGKSVFFIILTKIWADYARTAAIDTFTASPFARHTTDLASLAGARLTTASESSGHKSWDESLIKQVTGGETISARLMRQDNFTFTPQFKLLFAGNQPPQLNNVNKATKRRFHMIPFNFTPLQPDLDLESKLLTERAEILSWAIEGCRMWQQHGLAKPAAVTEATESYLEDQDVFGEWLEQTCDLGCRNAEESSKDLWASWSDFAKRAGENPGSRRYMANMLKSKGFQLKRATGGRRMYSGLSLSNGVDLG